MKSSSAKEEYTKKIANGDSTKGYCLKIVIIFLMFTAVLASGPIIIKNQYAGAATLPAEEPLKDPLLQQRAQDLYRLLRCPVCAGESIADSNTPTSASMRALVQKELIAGTSDHEILNYFQARYSEGVLMAPQSSSTHGWILWGPFALLIIGIISLFIRPKK